MSRPLPRTTVHPNHTRITPARHSVRGDRVKRLLLCGAIFSALLPGAALAHSGGHQGGCQDFGHINGYIAQDAEAVGDSLGIAGARNLGDIVSTFAHIPDGRGVGDIVEDVDHAACGTN